METIPVSQVVRITVKATAESVAEGFNPTAPPVKDYESAESRVEEVGGELEKAVALAQCIGDVIRRMPDPWMVMLCLCGGFVDDFVQNKVMLPDWMDYDWRNGVRTASRELESLFLEFRDTDIDGNSLDYDPDEPNGDKGGV